MCTRVVLSGTFQVITDEAELAFAQKALFARHPAMATWPVDHGWVTAKLVVDDIWEIDMYGGASQVDPADYQAVWAPAME